MKNPFANLFKKKAQDGEKNITPQPSEKKDKKKGFSFCRPKLPALRWTWS